MKRGIRNNNPLNIRRSSDRWVGARPEQTDKEFVQFQSMAYGYRAAWKTLQSYYRRFCSQSQPFTVPTIIGRWAPPGENNTEAYIRSVLLLSGLGGKENLLPPENPTGYYRISRLVAAMTCIECGIPFHKVDMEAIYKGYQLAFPDNKEELEELLCEQDEYLGWSGA